MRTEMTQLGSPRLTKRKQTTWVQTERKAHEAWAQLVRTNQRAAALLHVLVANMDQQAAVVASRATLARLVGYSEATVKRAVADLRAERWIEVVQLGGKGGVNAYVVNSRVAWATNRDMIVRAMFTARVLASADEQDRIDTDELRRIPTLYPGERQLPTGDGEDPPSQPALPDMEPDLPAIHAESVDPETGEIFELERRGQQRLID